MDSNLREAHINIILDLHRNQCSLLQALFFCIHYLFLMGAVSNHRGCRKKRPNFTEDITLPFFGFPLSSPFINIETDIMITKNWPCSHHLVLDFPALQCKLRNILTSKIDALGHEKTVKKNFFMYL